jgi:hypothetical protein
MTLNQLKSAAFVLTAWASVSFVGAVFWLGVYLGVRWAVG